MSTLASKIAQAKAAKVSAPTKPFKQPHIMVRAGAGVGKTFSLMTGVAAKYATRIPGLWHELERRVGFKISPSPEQQRIWDAMMEGEETSIRYVAFSGVIVREFKQKWGWMADILRQHRIYLDFSTMHSAGWKAVLGAAPGVKLTGTDEHPIERVDEIITDLTGYDIREMRKSRPVLLGATKALVKQVKMNLVPLDIEDEADRMEVVRLLDDLADHYDIPLQDEKTGRDFSDQVFDLVPKVIERCRLADGTADFDDQIWLPVVHPDMPVRKVDMLLYDEFQDANRCQHALASRLGDRMVLVGDERQAIFGFAGADCKSMARKAEELRHSDRGLKELTLSVTRRCGKAIVREANKIVTNYEAHESNPEGLVTNLTFENYTSQVRDGDFILARVNAPLVSQCFRFIREGRKATIQGRNVAEGLASLINRMHAVSTVELVARVDDWLRQETVKENAKRSPSESRVIALCDKAQCVVALTEGTTTVAEVLARIDRIFTDNREAAGIRLSSIHRAKGLEAKRVFFIRTKDSPCPHPMASKDWAREQEFNLYYVAVTRAQDELIFVGD